jgi:anti-anti-sigma factor
LDDFNLDVVDEIVIVKVNLFTATFRDAQPFGDFIETHLIFNQKKIIIDLSSCHFVDSTFVGMIIKIFKKVRERESSLKLVFPQLNSIIAFSVTGITKFIGCYDTLNQAREAMNSETSEREVVNNIMSFTN